MLQVIVEFTNLAKTIAGQDMARIEMQPGATFADLVEELGKIYPDLVGVLIDTDGKTFLSSNMFIVNNEMSLPIMVMDQLVRDGDRLTLVSVPTGG
jgi:molybdopterin converting factor small subunit